MQTSTLVVLLCFVAVAYSKTLGSPAVDALELDSAHEVAYDAPEVQRLDRNKRSLLLLKKKLLLGAVGLKAAKVGAVGGVVAGAALAAKKKPKVISFGSGLAYGYKSHGPSWNVEVNSWH